MSRNVYWRWRRRVHEETVPERNNATVHSTDIIFKMRWDHFEILCRVKQLTTNARCLELDTYLLKSVSFISNYSVRTMTKASLEA